MKMFHTEAKREYTIEKKVEHEKSKIEHLQSQKDPSQAVCMYCIVFQFL